MGGDGPAFTLFGEDLLGFCGLHRLGCEGSMDDGLA
jgi:hypothetical protein